MSVRKAITSLVATMVIGFLMVGCSDSGADESSGTSSQEGVETVKFMHLWPEGSSAQHHRVVSDIISGFEAEHEDIKIDLEVLSNEQYKDKLKVLSTSNELPDVGMTWAAGFLEPYVNGNKFAALDDILEGDLNDLFVSGTTEAYAVEDTTYGLPLELNIVSVYYNKTIFEENNVEVPETYEEFKEVVTTLKDGGVDPIALGNRDSWTGSMWYMYFADRIGGEDTLTSAINREGSFEDPALIQAAEEVQSLVDMGAFVGGFNGLSDEEAKSMFMNGQSAMYMIATWDLPNYTTNEDVPQEFRDSVDYFSFPLVDDKGDMDSFVGGPGVGLFVSEESEVKDAAKEFVVYFAEEWGDRAVTEVGIIPATKVESDELDLPEMYGNVLDDLNNATNITLFADVQMSADVADVHLNQIQALFGGEITPEEFTKAHEEAFDDE